MTEKPSSTHWRIESFGQGHMISLDLRLPDEQRLQMTIHVHLTDRLPARDLKAQALRQALAHIQGIQQSVEQG